MRRPLLLVVLGVLALSVAGWFVTRSPLVPYNVRELLVAERPALSVLLLSLLVYWTLGAPVWLARQLARGGRATWAYPGLLVLHAVGAWAMLRFAVPVESIHDVVGSPVLGWPWDWELLGRFAALYGAVSMVFTTAALALLVICAGTPREKALPWLGYVVVLAPLLHWVVVRAAATDNLTELMAGGGTAASSIWLAAFLGIVALAGTLTAALLSNVCRRRRSAVLAFLAVSYPLAYFAVTQGTATAIEKYGQVFSALQFLLSPDRASYVGQAELIARYAVLHSAAWIAVCLVQYPFWSRLPTDEDLERRDSPPPADAKRTESA